MSNIDNHMDELFQKAAENYPLKTEPGNFDDLLPFVGVPSDKPKKESKNKRKSIFILFLFLLTGSMVGSYILINTKSSNYTDNKKLIAQYSYNNRKTKNIQKINYQTSIVINEKKEKVSKSKAQLAKTISEDKKLSAFIKPLAHNFITSLGNNKKREILDAKNEKSTMQLQIAKEIVKETQPEISNTTIINNSTEETNETRTKVDIKIEAKKEAKKEIATAGNRKKMKLSLYYGLTAGIEFNEVKNQEMTKPGYNGGIVLGLKFNQHLAIETGLLLSQKKYYSEGKYFNPKPGTMPTNMIVTSLNGSCIVAEIPVAIKYNFTKNSNTLFAKAGLSSYLMTKENNQYLAIINGQQKEVNSIYTTSNYYGSANVNLSIGYQHKISNHYNFRVEPYLQIPIKGIGIGSMPVTAVGVRIGVIHFSQ